MVQLPPTWSCPVGCKRQLAAGYLGGSGVEDVELWFALSTTLLQELRKCPCPSTNACGGKSIAGRGGQHDSHYRHLMRIRVRLVGGSITEVFREINGQ